MIKKVEIENYKSIDKLDLEIGQFNVFIGENGCGKSNILEAIAFSSSFSDMDNGKLLLKGIRVTEPKYFRNGFSKETELKNINVVIYDDVNKISFLFKNTNEPYSNWTQSIIVNDNAAVDNIRLGDKYKELLADVVNKIKSDKVGSKVLEFDDDLKPKVKIAEFNEWFTNEKNEVFQSIVKQIVDNHVNIISFNNIPTYIIFAPENYFLRNYNIDTPYNQPLGTKGEGLLKLFKVIKNEKPQEYKEIVEALHLIDWFEDIEITEDSLSGSEFKLNDKYLEEGIGGFDIKNANEGFFLLLFYITLFVSDYTPAFFAIDNIDTALNPKLCTKLIEVLTVLAKKHNKQVLITTHNPSILDGLNLNDPEQRLFAVSRNKSGYTRATRIEKKPPLEGEKSLKLSEQFLRGYIGGIPKNF